MSLIDTIRADALAARKARAIQKATFLVTLLGEVERVGKDAGNRATTDAEAQAVIKKFAKNIDEVLAVRPGDEAALFERATLAAYRPTQLTGAALEAAITAVLADLGCAAPTAKDVGAVMKALNARHAGAFDGAEASTRVRARLSA